MAICGMWIAIVFVMVFFAGVQTHVNSLSKPGSQSIGLIKI